MPEQSKTDSSADSIKYIIKLKMLYLLFVLGERTLGLKLFSLAGVMF